MYRLSELLSGIKILAFSKQIECCEVSGISSDSRATKKDEIFICIKGIKSNGHDHIDQAVCKGAKVILYSDDPQKLNDKAIYIKVKDTRSALSKMYANLYKDELRRLKLIAITGTNGKTTVSKMIESVLNLDTPRCAVIGTLGASFNEETQEISTMTTPDPERLYPILADYARKGVEYVVMEASSHSLALKKLDGLKFEIAAITNMTAEHLDFHGNMHRYYNAKASLFAKAKKGVFLCDDYYTVKMYKEAKCQKVSCSVMDKRCDYYAENSALSFENGTIFTVVGKGREFPLHSNVAADFTVSNALLAAAILSELKTDSAAIYKGIATLDGVSGRFERIDTGRDFSVYIDFAHTPDALSKLLQGVKRMKKQDQRIVTLFGCGGERDRSKRPLMGRIASHLSDLVIVTSDNCRSENADMIIDEIMSGVDKSRPHVRIKDRQKAIEHAILHAQSGDIILLCGKGHERYEINNDGIHDFSERDIVCAALEKKKGEG